MMKALQNKVTELFENGTITLMIGFRGVLDKFAIPVFITEVSQADQLIWTPACLNNLSVYLHKSEVKQVGKIGIIGNAGTLRSLLQLISENQLKELELTILTINEQNEVIVFASTEELEVYVQANCPAYNPEDQALVDKLNAMTREERWKYWTGQLSACVKCYACRAVCPMCYCSVCTVECNQPQWIKLSSETEGNLEWHIMRAMHLAGRCINCGECGRICPAGIPLQLLTVQMNQEIERAFGGKTGFSAKSGYALNTFKTEDKETFIR